VGNVTWKRHIDQLRLTEIEQMPQSNAESEITELTGSTPFTRDQGNLNTLPDASIDNDPLIKEYRYPQRDKINTHLKSTCQEAL